MSYASFISTKATPVTNQRVVDAVNFLIDASNCEALIGELTQIVETWDVRPMSYSGTHRVLNAIIDVGARSREAFDRLIQLVRSKRARHPQAKRSAYQRDLMRERRARMAKALDLHELTHGPLRGASRMAEMQAIQSRWAEARRKFIALKGELSWHDRNAASQEFWDMVDTKLDLNLKSAQRIRVVA